MLGDIPHGRPFDPRRRIMPTDTAASAVIRRVVGITPVEREVDAADECHAVVDHDRLLVVTVRRAGARVESALDLRVARQCLLHFAHVSTRRPERGDRRSLPEQHAHVDPLGQLGEQDPDDQRLLFAAQRELGREKPPREVDMRRGGRHLRAIRGSASAPSIRISSVFPGRGGAVPRAYANAVASRACSHPTRRRPRRCRLLTALSILLPSPCPSFTVRSSRNRGGRT